MILTCPSCGTQYAVKDGAIPPQGRQVRCASCKHAWHQDPESGPVPEQSPAEEQPAEVAVPPSEDAPGGSFDDIGGPEGQAPPEQAPFEDGFDEQAPGDEP